MLYGLMFINRSIFSYFYYISYYIKNEVFLPRFFNHSTINFIYYLLFSLFSIISSKVCHASSAHFTLAGIFDTFLKLLLRQVLLILLRQLFLFYHSNKSIYNLLCFFNCFTFSSLYHY